MDIARSHVLICGGTGCTSSKSDQIAAKMEAKIKSEGLDKEVKVVQTGCFGLCALGPIMVVYPEGAFYSKVTVDDVDEIVEEHLLKGRIVKRLLYDETVTEDENVIASDSLLKGCFTFTCAETGESDIYDISILFVTNKSEGVFMLAVSFITPCFEIMVNLCSKLLATWQSNNTKLTDRNCVVI